MGIASRHLLVGCLVAAFSTGAFAQTTHDVQLSGSSFTPADITIELGDTVHWVWISGTHNVESGTIVGGTGVPDGNFISGSPTSGVTFDLLFDQAFIDANPMPGEVYPYYCIIHVGSNMAGTITVNLPAGAVPTASTWGVATMALALLAAATVLLARKRAATVPVS